VKSIILSILLTLLLAAVPTSIEAKCGFGIAPSYADIDEIVLTQTGCGSTLTPGTPITIECSKFWARFEAGTDTEYSQFNLEHSVGDFHLAATLADARKILQNDSFFLLNPPAQEVPTDVAVMTITVWRCATTTSLKVYSSFQQAAPPTDSETESLFNDLRILIANSQKTRLDESPHKLFDTFDPWN
jgi:hypothetical protein